MKNQIKTKKIEVFFLEIKSAQNQTRMSYNLRPRKNTVDYRVLNGYKSKSKAKTVSQSSSPVAETSTTEEIQPIVKKTEPKVATALPKVATDLPKVATDLPEFVPINFENMDLETQKKYQDAITNIKAIRDTLDGERNIDKRAELVLNYLNQVYQLIVNFRDYNPIMFRYCNNLGKTYLMKYNELKDQIVHYCVEYKKYGDLNDFHKHYRDMEYIINKKRIVAKQSPYPILNESNPEVANALPEVATALPEVALSTDAPKNLIEENMDTKTKDLFYSEKAKSAILQEMLKGCTDATSKITFCVKIFEQAFHFIIHFRNLNPTLSNKCKSLTKNFLELAKRANTRSVIQTHMSYETLLKIDNYCNILENLL